MNYRKTAISLPEDVFEQGEQVAAEMGISRSELYTQALRHLIHERKVEAIRAQLYEALQQDTLNATTTLLAADLHGAASATIHRAAERGESTW